MNRVIYVPEEARVRATMPESCLVQEVEQIRRVIEQPSHRWIAGIPVPIPRKKTVAEADKLALARGWVRLSDLPPAEQRRWRGAHRKEKAQTRERDLPSQ